MTYLLTDGLPHSVSVNGVPFEVETDFRLFIAFERDAFLERWHEREAYDTLRKFYQGTIPDDVNGALEAFLDFYRRGRFEAVDARGKPNYPTGGRSANAYAFDTDDRRIYAAFLRQYGIDLTAARLHWFTFRCLLESLFDREFREIVGYRLADTSRLDKERRKEVQKLQRAYEIRRPCPAGQEDADPFEARAASIRAKLEKWRAGEVNV